MFRRVSRSPAHQVYHASTASARAYSTSQSQKTSIKLVAELRKLTDVPLSKAKEALIATNNDLDAAVEWVQKDLAISGAKKAAKVGDRETREGLIGISVLSPGYGQGTAGVRAAMVELNCETDFVGRNELFGKLVQDIAHSTAFHSEVSNDFQVNPKLLRPFEIDALLDAPFINRQPNTATSSSTSVGSAIRDTIAKVGENISLRRAVSVVMPGAPESYNAGVRVASYVHGSTIDPSVGRIGTLALLYLKSPRLSECFKSEFFMPDIEKLERALARQIVGFETESVRQVSANAETALYEQPFMMLPGELSGRPVKSVLRAWAEQKGLVNNPGDEDFHGVAVSEFVKWSVGQDATSVAASVVSCTSTPHLIPSITKPHP